MKTISQIAKENNTSVNTLYRRIRARGISPRLEKGIIVFNSEEEKSILTYSKRGRKNAQDKKAQDLEQVAVR